MTTAFTVFIYVSRPCADVYDAVADPAILSRYFTTGGAQGRLVSGATVSWDFADFPERFAVDVIEAVPPLRIAIRWPANGPDAEPYQTDALFTFEPVDRGTRTKVTVTEQGWPDNPSGRKASYGNCMGWSQMLAALKCWCEHGINLREKAYK